MSWTQRKGPSRPTATGNPPVQMYNPNQHSNPEWQATNLQPWQPPPPHQQQSARQDPNQRQPYWPQQPQPPQPTYPTSHTPNGTPGQYQQQYEQPGYFQNTAPVYNQQAYGNVQYSQQYDQNNLYSSQQQPTNEWASWEWGDDDNSNTQPVAPTQPPAANQPLADSFAHDESWNWSVNEQPEQNNMFPTVGDLKSKTDANRKKLETPQWSTESQPSVESSDDVLQTSESDKSHMVSRSSTISHSPISGQEISPPLHQIENNEVVTQRVNPTPPLPKNVQTPPLLLPPQGGAGVQSDNPYKRTAGLSHKAAHKFKPPPPPTAVTQTFNQAANLETLPDNSEHPDYPVVGNTTKTSSGSVVGPQWAQIENNEAPIDDRNQYLETGQLSEVSLSADPSESADVGNDTLPPPGLQRMIPGQMEQSESSDGQPLPGFSRMVLGQNESNSELSNQNPSQYDLNGPPEGLRRMVPGESSSPETSMRQPHAEENDSELELNQLAQNHGTQPTGSAAIGADTPPIQGQQQSVLQSAPANRSETIGSDLAVTLGGDASDLPQTSSVMESKPGKHAKVSKEKNEPDTRREAVEGQTNDLSVSGLTAAVRNLTVGENLTDGHTSNNSMPELSPRRHSKQESSDSDSDRKMARNHRSDKRTEKSKSREKERDRGERDRYRERNNERERYSPDPYREKRGKRYRDRRYEEQDTDYNSDKERRPRDDRDRDYERKYSSLRKDKDRRRKEPREYRESRRGGDYYYGRYGGEDYGPENRSSRPSSRSDSMHESYRERRHEGGEHRERRNRDRDRERYNRNREPYNSRDVYNPYQNFAYDPYYRHYQYYENLRRTNPEAYAEWYRKYYQQAAGSTYTGEDRASVHSGRSSANDELNKDRYTRQSFYSQSNYYGQSHSISGHYGLDNSSMTYNRDQTDNSLIYEEQPSAVQRLTPTKFATAHLKASIASGRLIRVQPNYPMDGQSAVVDVCNLQTLLEHDPNYIELCSFPGPLIKGVTHKKQIIEYCDSKIRGATYNRDIADVESYILMWELLILLIRQNGMVVGTDIAELLLKSRNSEPIRRPSSVLSNTSSNVGDRNEVSEASNQPVSEQGSTLSILKEEEVTKKFREFLLYGSCQEALEWAMKHGLWGHALFLASKLDKRTYANVMMRFANGLTMNDPLQTLYQLLSGKMPAVVTCASDEKWGDWRPHLAMILSNSTQRPELNCKAITQLGDTLLNRGSLYAAQFCYLMAEAGFGRHGDPDAKLVLLGSDHRKPFPQVATNEAIHMTEIYEFACSLNVQEFSIPDFQFYKFLLASRLADFGLLQRSLQYLELLAKRIIYNSEGVAPSLIEGVCTLADKLKFYDPVGDAEEGDELEFGAALETSRPDNSWLKDLRAIQIDCRAAPANQDYEGLHATISTDNTLQQSGYGQDAWQQEQQLYDQQQQMQFELQQQQYQEPTSVWGQEQPNQGGFHSQESQPLLSAQTSYPEQQNYWPGQQPPQPWSGEPQQTPVNQDPVPDLYDNSNNQFEEPRPQISLPNQPKGSRSAFDDAPLPHEKVDNQSEEASKPKPQSPKKDGGGSQNTGWFGGIFSRFSKSKNEVKLPDDKNPKIVWDENKKRWVNLDEDPNDQANELKPPPKMAQMAPQLRGPGTLDDSNAHASFVGFSSGTFNNNVVDYNMTSGPMSLPVLGTAPTRNDEAAVPRSAAPQTNMFKMQRNRNVKNAYVDVFKQNGVKSEPVPAPEPVPLIGQPASMNFFIPQPVANQNAPVDFLTPGGAPLQSGEAQ